MRSLGPAELFVAAAVGEPGARTFFIHVVANGEPFWVHAEKEQVAALGAQSLQLLAESKVTASRQVVEEIVSRIELPEPGEPSFRLGGLTLQASPERELVTVAIVAAEEEAEGIEFDIAPEQLQAMALKALHVVGQGRPLCELCRLPKDPDGHRCPSTNGHHAD